ncbi:MAG: flavodoxin family protein [Candidatus Thermoplasmatota archaeon]
MPWLVIYYSETGNTELVAKAIAEILGTRAVKVGEGDEELVVIGSPTHGGKPVEPVMEFIKRTTAKKAAIFCTCGADSGETLIEMENGLSSRGIEVVGKLEIKVGDKKPTDVHLRKAKEFGKSIKRC